MTTRTISATEAARNLSDVLNQVRYQSAEFDIVRGKEVVARLVPALPARGVPLSQANELMAALPRLGPKEADAFARDIERGLERIGTDTIEWD
jgi:antitoxin (DNA-binding transcriptional repressor) of toxin-antitoxin stability system